MANATYGKRKIAQAAELGGGMLSFDQPILRDVLAEEIWPGSDISSRNGSNRLDGGIRAQARTIYHPAGTCRMGASGDAVVGTASRVGGVQGLRGADCSVMPAVVSGNKRAGDDDHRSGRQFYFG